MVILEKKIYLFVWCILLDGCGGKDSNKKEQVFPMLMKTNCNVFSHKDTSFALQKEK